MSKLAVRVIAILLANTVAGWWWLAESRPPIPCARWETDANLDVMPSDTAFDTVIAGSSHGWALTACPDSARVTQGLLGGGMHNLSKPACGPLPTLCYVEPFYARGNRADVLVYFVDPWAIAYRKWNEDAAFLYNEPFQSAFILRCLRNGVNPREVAAALRFQFRPRQPFDAERLTRCERVLDGINPASVRRRLRFLYPGPFDPASVARYEPVVQSIVEEARAQGSNVLIVLPPTLLGDLPGMDALREFLTALDRQQDVAWLDLSEAIDAPHLFQDHDHLNAEGTREFIVNYPNPALNELGS